jgi:hypothetical protein
MDAVIKILNVLAMLVPVLLGTGIIVKYVPFLKGLSNQLIPLLNAIIAFLALFGGGAAPAQAGIFGDVGSVFAWPAKAAAAVLISLLTSKIYDKFLKGITPPPLTPAPATVSVAAKPEAPLK